MSTGPAPIHELSGFFSLSGSFKAVKIKEGTDDCLIRSSTQHRRGISDSLRIACQWRFRGIEQILASKDQISQKSANSLDSRGKVYFSEVNFSESTSQGFLIAQKRYLLSWKECEGRGGREQRLGREGIMPLFWALWLFLFKVFCRLEVSGNHVSSAIIFLLKKEGEE